jgi:hypothetical protein
MPGKKRKWSNGRKQKRTARLNLVVEPWLKKAIHHYSSRSSKSLSSIITDHFLDLLKKEEEPNVEQI